MTFFMAELRKWVKLPLDRDTYQGYVFNDDSHTNENGKFITIEADDILVTEDCLIVTVKKHLYYLWDTFKRGVE